MSTIITKIAGCDLINQSMLLLQNTTFSSALSKQVFILSERISYLVLVLCIFSFFKNDQTFSSRLLFFVSFFVCIYYVHYFLLNLILHDDYVMRVCFIYKCLVAFSYKEHGPRSTIFESRMVVVVGDVFGRIREMCVCVYKDRGQLWIRRPRI